MLEFPLPYKKILVKKRNFVFVVFLEKKNVLCDGIFRIAEKNNQMNNEEHNFECRIFLLAD